LIILCELGEKGGDAMYQKIYVTQGIIEVYEYEKLNLGGCPDRDGDGINSEDNYKARMRERRNKIRRLICQNFDSESKFITLTFRDTEEFDIRNVKECNQRFKLFIKRMRYKYKDLKYVAVIEFQDKNSRGAVHYHMICNLPYVKKQELAKTWGEGFVKINAIDKVDNIGAYVIKYMTAESGDKRLQAENGYLRSQNLENPVELKSWVQEEQDNVKELIAMLSKETPSYGGKPYESEHAGKINYSQYNMNRVHRQS
jgi:hypothetical protein